MARLLLDQILKHRQKGTPADVKFSGFWYDYGTNLVEYWHIPDPGKVRSWGTGAWANRAAFVSLPDLLKDEDNNGDVDANLRQFAKDICKALHITVNDTVPEASSGNAAEQ